MREKRLKEFQNNKKLACQNKIGIFKDYSGKIDFFEDSTNFIYTAKFIPDFEAEFCLNSSKQGNIWWHKMGYAKFIDHNNKEQKLLILSPLGEKKYFLAFFDQSNGFETYQGGRYLESKLKDGKLILDFNFSYHPACFFGDFSCLIPPKENFLDFKILAGERIAK